MSETRPPGESEAREEPHHRYTSLSSLMKDPPAGSPVVDNKFAKKKSSQHLHVTIDPSEASGSRSRSRSKTRRSAKDKGKDEKAKMLSTWRLLALTVSMGGSQVCHIFPDAETVRADAADCLDSVRSQTRTFTRVLTYRELGYGTPYLLSLGLSEQLTSLVWLAGPISGLITQPLIGAISDSSLSRYRRRYWIVTATILLVISGLGLAFTEPVAKALVDLFGGGQGDWDPKSIQLVCLRSAG